MLSNLSKLRATSTFLGLLASICAVSACGDHADGHTHELSRRAVSPQLTPPTRPLEWGDINIIHTTDSHGWLLGHQKASFPEPNYRCSFFLIYLCENMNTNGVFAFLFALHLSLSGDFGDFASFVSHMKQIAIVCVVSFIVLPKWDFWKHAGTRCRSVIGGFWGSSWRWGSTKISVLSAKMVAGTGLVDGFPPGGIDAHDVRFPMWSRPVAHFFS